MAQLQWGELKELLADALEVDEPQRKSHLERVCGSNAELRRQLEQLLEYESDAPSDQPVDVSSSRAAEDWIGPCRLIELIGEGGMGTVFKAEQRYPVKRIVAIK